jgi:hypothetical protein
MAETVAHYLKLYRLRQSTMERGVTNPSAEGRALINTLVEQLGALDPNLPCELHITRDAMQNERAAFVVNGQVVASIVIPAEST